MNHQTRKLVIILGFAVLVSAPAFAKQPQSPGSGNDHKSPQDSAINYPDNHERGDSSSFFDLDRRTIIRNYYSKSRKSDHCPPGLAKKNNGCQPPGQIKKWRKGEPLPHDVTYFDLPGTLLNELGHTPEGAKVVQVGMDLLLISIATGTVLDAIGIQE